MLLRPVYIIKRKRKAPDALSPYLSPRGNNKVLGSRVPCNQDEVILQAAMKEPFVECLLCDRPLLIA